MTTSKTEKRKIWMVLDHSQELATALALASYWERKEFVSNLLISPHPYWRKVDFKLYEHQFDKIVFLERPDNIPAPFPKPGRILTRLHAGRRVAKLKGEPAGLAIRRMILRRLRATLLYPAHLLGLILKIRRVKKEVARLAIQQSDILIWLAVGHFADSIVLSMHPHNLKIAVINSEVYQRGTSPVDRDIYQDTFEGWVANRLIEPITGLHRTYKVRSRAHPELPLMTRYRKSLPEIYDGVVVLGESSNPEIELGDNVIRMPYPYVLIRNGIRNNYNHNKLKKVVFFGSKFTGAIAGIIDPEVYAKRLNSCLDFVREKYGADYKLVYRPHPREDDGAGPLDLNRFEDELRFLNLDQFEIETDGMMAELYFCRNVENIHSVFSVESTSSRSALHFFINAYSFLDIFPYDVEMKTFFKSFIGDVPDEFYLDDLSTVPVRYVKTKDMSETMRKCQNVLDTLLVKLIRD